jgi:hypothetical protein
MTDATMGSFWAITRGEFVVGFEDRPEVNAETREWTGAYLFTMRDTRWRQVFGVKPPPETSPVFVSVLAVECNANP